MEFRQECNETERMHNWNCCQNIYIHKGTTLTKQTGSNGEKETNILDGTLFHGTGRVIDKHKTTIPTQIDCIITFNARDNFRQSCINRSIFGRTNKRANTTMEMATLMALLFTLIAWNVLWYPRPNVHHSVALFKAA